MDQHVWLVSSLFALLVALVFRPDLILVCVVVVLTLACSALALSVSAQWYFDRKPPAPSNTNPPTRRELEALKRFMQELLPHSSGQGGRRLPVIFGRTLDDILQKLIDLTLRDFVQSWLEESGFGNADQIVKDIKADLWKVIARLQERAARVDLAQLIAVDMISKVTAHFERLRVLQTNEISDSSEITSLSVTTSDNLLSSPEAERQYLRKVAELCLMFLFSPEYMALDPVRHLLRELLVCKVFQPCIESLTDPDSINRKLLAYIEQQAAASAAAAAEVGTGGRSLIAEGYTPATSFEDLLLMIKQCQDIQVLKHIRYNIVTEIMQATASGGGGATRRYLIRLSQAQARCEARLQDLGESQDFRNGRKTPRSTNEGVEEATEALQASKKLQLVGSPMMNVLASAEARIFLSEYLDSQQTEGEAGRQMLNFWEATEALKSAASADKHQLATGIFYTHVNAPNSAVLVEKGIRKRMESFLLGNGGPDAFFEVQSQVVANLEAKYWSGFSTSPQYTAMQSSLAERAQEASETAFDDDTDDTSEEYSKISCGDAPTRSRTRLGRLQEKLDNKIQALEALRTSLKPESRILSALESEVDTLRGELTQLQAHLTRTEVWSEHLGRWRAVVQSAEVSSEELQFVIVVHVAEDETDKEAVSTGWVVLRRLHHFLQLHRKLCQVNPAVKSFELPSAPLKFRLSKSATPASLDKATYQIQKYLKFVLEDDKLSANEALYAFLSPSSEHLKYGGNLTVSNFNSSEPKRNKKFSLATLFKVQELRDAFMTGGGEENNSLLIEPTPGIATGLDGKDAIAEPLYSLLGEIFDLRGVFKWLRKTLITFVQITYGRTINRQVRETIAWMVSEPMAYYYIQTIIKTWWPGGKLTHHDSTRTELQKEQTRSDARTQFLNNVPELLSSLVGQQNARRGAIKVFESLQQAEYNKHLFYELLDVVLTEIFPETKMD